MDALRPVDALPVFRRLPAAARPAAPDRFQPGTAAAEPTPRKPSAPTTERVRARLFKPGPSGMEEVRTYRCDGEPVPVRDAKGLSFILASKEDGVRRVTHEGEEVFAFPNPGQTCVGDRIYTLHEGRLEARSLEDGRPLAAGAVPDGATLARRPQGGVYARAEDRLQIFDADLKLLREVEGPPGHVAELAHGALALHDWRSGDLVVLDGQGDQKCSLERVSRAKQGPDGAIWGVQNDEIVRVDPGTGTVRRLPGASRDLQDLLPRADGSYLVHSRPDLTKFTLTLHSPDGVETQTFQGRGCLEDLQADGRSAWGMVGRWQDRPNHTALERFDLGEARGFLNFGAEKGTTVHRMDVPDRGATQRFVPLVLGDGRVAVAGPREGLLLDRDGAVLQRFATAEDMRRALPTLHVAPRDLGDPITADPDEYLRRMARIHCTELPAGFARGQGAFPAVGGVQFSRPGEVPQAPLEVEDADLSRLFESSHLPERSTFPSGAGSLTLHRDATEGDALVVEVPDPAHPGGFVRRNYRLDEFEQYTRLYPISTDRGQYVVAADDQGRAWWLDPAGGGDRRFELKGALAARVFSEHALMLTGQEGQTLLLELPSERILIQRHEPRSGDAPRIITSETEVRLGGVTLPIRR